MENKTQFIQGCFLRKNTKQRIANTLEGLKILQTLPITTFQDGLIAVNASELTWYDVVMTFGYGRRRFQVVCY